MAKDEAPPQFLKPGDDPEVDALLARLKKDGEDGDPLYVDLRKRRRARLRVEAATGATNATATEAPEAAEEGPGSDASPAPAPPAEPLPVELPTASPLSARARGNTPGTPAHSTPRWLLWAALAVTAPVVAILIGFLWSHHRATPAPAAATSAAPSASATASVAPSANAAASAAPLPSVTASAPAPAATANPAPAESVQIAPTAPAGPRTVPVKPHGKRVPARDEPHTDAPSPTAPTVTATPSAMPAPPPVRTEPEETREF